MRSVASLAAVVIVVIVVSLVVGCAQEERRKGVGEPCNSSADCVDEVCHRGTCCPATPTTVGQPCQVDAQCVSFNCSNNVCAAGTTGKGEACRDNAECLSGQCTITSGSTGVCAARGGPDAGADGADGALPDGKGADGPAPDAGTPDAGLRPANAACTAGAQCESGTCHHSLCTSASPAAQGSVCKGDADCLSFVCTTAGICGAGTAANGDACLNQTECLSQICTGNLCVGKASSATCAAGGECASGVCHNTLCAAAKPGASGSACTVDGDCLSWVCTASVCAAGTTANGDVCLDKEECLSQICTGGLCAGKAASAACTADGECASGTCHNSLCAAASPAGLGSACNGDGDCLSYVCTSAGVCGVGSAVLGAACLDGEECASGKCTAGLCVQSCGNKVMEGTEACDTTDFGSKPACSDWGYAAGSLVCKPDCSAVLVEQCFTLTDPAGIQVTAGPTDPGGRARVAFTGTSYLVIWNKEGPSSNDPVLARRVATNGTVMDATDISVGTAYYVDIEDLACDGSDTCLVVMGDTTTLRGRIIDTSKGTAGVTAYITTGIAYGPGTARRPRVAFDGTNFVVVWHDGRSGGSSPSGIYGSRVTPGGVVMDSATNGFKIADQSTSETDPAVASNGKGESLVIWRDKQSGTYDIHGAVVNGSGTVGASFAVNTSSKDLNSPDVGYGGGQYLAVWESSGVLSGARVATTGGSPSVLDATGVAIATGVTGSRAAHDGTNFVVVYHTTTSPDIKLTRVTPSGKSALSLTLSSASGTQAWSDVTHGGGQFFAAWEDERNLGTTGRAIYGARFK